MNLLQVRPTSQLCGRSSHFTSITFRELARGLNLCKRKKFTSYTSTLTTDIQSRQRERQRSFPLHFHSHLRVKGHYFLPCFNGTKRLSKIKIKCSSVWTKKVRVILLSLLSFIFISRGLKDKFLLNTFSAPCGYSSKISVPFMEAVKIKPK